ncbi:MAG: hypothetical protein B7Y25_04075 [Alphaproteobacteria bacterium 16-39-46]|nr:MAG: hypothetical protein B7Y25_04075 [Alphaproteobacteria bacterium 16-39-46]OZA43868.1 MAG: hypothetical protein B7X84_02050 [Alphaproteobacteria bacterium 17-39-52]HQS84652.1 hypothetical protein [Alphaproteobacteria bacterium]HQS94490.1 hypothetical protein [Alphaproteobacteria bacterium]
MKNKITLLSFSLIIGTLAGGSVQVEAGLSRSDIPGILENTKVTGTNKPCNSKCNANDSLESLTSCVKTHCPPAYEKAKALIG